mmetsp:Transcript_4956/g.10662  ORF Transcript_4956/g.10662 Transcript_4956/m.10662 type:complete len:219 (+) Transcript_4956:102-758(+)
MVSQLTFIFFSLALAVTSARPSLIEGATLHKSLSCSHIGPCKACPERELPGPPCKATGWYQKLTCTMQGEAGAAGSMLHLPLPLPEGHGVQHQGDIVHVTRTCLAPTQQQEEQQQEHQEQQHGEALQQLTPSHHNPTHPTAEVQPGASLSALAARLVLHLPLTRRRAQETMTEGNEELHPSHSPHTSMSLLNFELIMLGVLGVSLPVVYWRKIRIRHL